MTPPPHPASELVRAAEADVPSDAPATTAEDATLPLSTEDVTETIEHERVELLQIHAMLKCLYQTLLYADDDDSVTHADVANVCARLINESVARLDKLLIHGGEHSSDELDESAVSE